MHDRDELAAQGADRRRYERTPDVRHQRNDRVDTVTPNARQNLRSQPPNPPDGQGTHIAAETFYRVDTSTETDEVVDAVILAGDREHSVQVDTRPRRSGELQHKFRQTTPTPIQEQHAWRCGRIVCGVPGVFPYLQAQRSLRSPFTPPIEPRHSLKVPCGY